MEHEPNAGREDAADCPDSLSFLVKSNVRVRILQRLRTEATFQELRATLSASRPTIQRNLRKLQRRGWVAEDPRDRTYRTTDAGELVVESFVSVCSKFDSLDAVTTVVKHLPDVDLPPIAELRRSRVVTSSATDPYRPATVVRETLEDATALRGFLPVLNPIFVEEALRLGADGQLDLVVTEDVGTVLRSRYAEQFPFLTERRAVRVVDEVPPYLVGVLDEDVLLASYDENFHMRAVLFAPSDDVREWANAQYEEVSERSAAPT